MTRLGDREQLQKHSEIAQRLLADDCHAARRVIPMLTEIITILLVEDNSADACLVQEMLRKVEAFQFQLIHVTRLEEALS